MQFIIVFLFCFIIAPPVIAQDAPIEITADQALEWDRDASTFIARGNAMAVQGETSLIADLLTATYVEDEDGMIIQKIVASGGKPTVKTASETLTAQNIIAHFTSDDKTQLEKVIATSNVQIETGTQVLRGNRAEYMPLEDRAVVTGNVQIIEGANTLTGDRAEFDMKTNTSTLQSDQKGGRVRAVFFPKSGGSE
jgi:lipopolysaccharide export system protein LptA